MTTTMSIFKKKRSLFSNTESDGRHSIFYRPKNFSYLGSTIKGAAIGTSVSTVLSKIPWFNNKTGGALGTIGLGTVIGGSLGALTELLSRGNNYFNRKANVGKDSILRIVVDILKRSGAREGVDFTRDPKRANLLKTKVCLSISKNVDDTKLLINTHNDPGLEKLTTSVVKGLPNRIAQTNRASDKFNDLTVTMLSSEADPDIISKAVQRFIKEGYPVYLIEAGV